VACERNCKKTKIKTSYAAVHGMQPVKENVE
jgi:hypothetical protein